MKNNPFSIPPAVIEQYNKLYDLVQNKSKNGRIDVADLAEYLGRTPGYVNNLIQNNRVPYAYCDGNSGRAVAQISVLPLFQYETQNNIFRGLGEGENV